MARNKAYRDPNGRHVRIYATLLNCPAYRVLGFSSKALFLDLRERVTGTNNGNIEATLSTLKHKGWASSATLASALRELQALGFLDITRRGGGVELGRRLCHLYRFTDLPTLAVPKLLIEQVDATHDYLKFETVAQAERALKEWVEEAKRETAEKYKKARDGKEIENSSLQKLKRDASEIESINANYRFKN